MSNQPSLPADRVSEFMRSVDHLTTTLAGIESTVETAQQRAANPGVLGSIRRLVAGQPAVPSAASREIHRFTGALKSLHGVLNPRLQAALQHEVYRINADLSHIHRFATERVEVASGKAEVAAAWKELADDLRRETARAVGAILPRYATPDPTKVPDVPGSILPPVARAFAAGTADREEIVIGLHERADLQAAEAQQRPAAIAAPADTVAAPADTVAAPAEIAAPADEVETLALKVVALNDEVEDLHDEVGDLHGEVAALSTEVEAPAPEIEDPAYEVEAIDTEVEDPAYEVEPPAAQQVVEAPTELDLDDDDPFGNGSF